MISFFPGVLVIIAYLPGSVSIKLSPSFWKNEPEYTVAQAYYMYLLAGCVLFVPFLSYSYHIIKTYLIAPPGLRKTMKTGLLGILFMLLSIPISLTGLSSAIPGSLKLNLALSFFFYSWMWYNEPKLVFILPFKAYRLLVINSESGIPLFKYDWDKDVVNEDLFSGLMMGISAFVKETIGKGALKEIHLDQAVLLIEKNEKVIIEEGDFPWLKDLVNLVKAEIAHKFAKFEEEAGFQKAFLDRQPMLFEPPLVFRFGLTEYQQILKKIYQTHKKAITTGWKLTYYYVTSLK
jgi:hypothetical protein